jgi:RHS repeat-associated protein
MAVSLQTFRTRSFSFQVNRRISRNSDNCYDDDLDSHQRTSLLGNKFEAGLGSRNQLISAQVGNSWKSDFIYDGMLVVQERTSANTLSVTYTPGTDLSGSIQGAGGIGGLFGRSSGYSSGSWTTHNHYHADGNGNITFLINSSQTIAASYKYNPFGVTITSSGTLASANTLRFSSKELIPNFTIYYYGYRFYDPNLQRWLNRDPISEVAGLNMYTFIFNSPNNLVDRFGLIGIPPNPFNDPWQRAAMCAALQVQLDALIDS